MKELFIPYEQALVLKEMGFDAPCLKVWEHTQFWTILINPEEVKKVVSERYCNAPLYQQAFDWFEFKYGLSGEVLKQAPYEGMSFTYWWYMIQDSKGEDITDWSGRFNDILDKCTQNVEDNHINDEKLEKYIIEDGFGFINSLKARQVCLEKLIEIVQNGINLQRQ